MSDCQTPSSLQALKIGVQFSGQMRFAKNNKSLLDFIQKINADVFIHSWTEPIDFGDHRIRTDTTPEEFIQVYKPKEYLFEIPNTIYHNVVALKPDLHAINCNRYKIMMYSWLQVNTIRKIYEILNSVKYDIIVRLRTDIKFNDGLSFDFISDIKDGECYIPNSFLSFDSMNDMFAISNSRIADIYHETLLKYRSDWPICPETILRNHLINNGVNIIQRELPYTLLRKNNNE